MAATDGTAAAPCQLAVRSKVIREILQAEGLGSVRSLEFGPWCSVGIISRSAKQLCHDYQCLMRVLKPLRDFVVGSSHQFLRQLAALPREPVLRYWSSSMASSSSSIFSMQNSHKHGRPSTLWSSSSAIFNLLSVVRDSAYMDPLTRLSTQSGPEVATK